MSYWCDDRRLEQEQRRLDAWQATAANKTLIEKATLAPQSFGIAMCQTVYGGPRGIWLNCTSCRRSDVIRGSNSDEWNRVPTAQAAEVFRRHGWTGEGPALLKARCPKCSSQ